MIQPDLALVKIFFNRTNYEKYIECLNVAQLQPEIKLIIQSLESYYKDTPDVEDVNPEAFATYFKHVFRRAWSDAQLEIYTSIFEKVAKEEVTDCQVILQHFQQRDIATRLIEHLEKDFNRDYIQEELDNYSKLLVANQYAFTDDDLDNILSMTNRGEGLHWKLSKLNQAVGYLRRGMLIIIAAGVDVGKTAFILSESVHMAKNGGKILLLNNEEDSYRVMKKAFKSFAGWNEAQLHERPDKVKAAWKQAGMNERFKILDIHGWTIPKILTAVKDIKPDLVIIDQADKVSTPKVKAFNDHGRLKDLYGELRFIANTYCPVIAVSQADVTTTYMNKDTQDVEYILYPHHRQLDGSKVGKPGEADAIIMIGRRTETNTTRGINVSKNKFGEPTRFECNFNGETCRYTD